MPAARNLSNRARQHAGFGNTRLHGYESRFETDTLEDLRNQVFTGAVVLLLGKPGYNR